MRIPARSDWEGWTEEVSYQSEAGEVSFPSRVRVAFSRAKMTVEIVHTFKKPTTCQRPQAEFFLPHYRLSESALGLPGTLWWPRWLLYGGSLLGLDLVGLFVTSWLRRKRSGT